MDITIHYAFLPHTDPDAALAFYRDTLGFEVRNDWVASASADGAPYLVPLSFDWDGEALPMATPTDSPTAS